MRKSRDLDDEALLRRIAQSAAQDHCRTAVMLSDIAEAEARKLHLRKGYDSMTRYCVEVLHYSENAARKRVHAAHIARKFPELLHAIAKGRLHLTAVRMLSTYLTSANVQELIAEATHKSESEIELILARRFPRAEPIRLDDGVTPQVIVGQGADGEGRAARRMDQLPEPAPAKVAPITVARFRLEASIDAETEDDLRAVQRLLGHSGSSCDVPRALKRALKHLRRHLEKRKFAQVDRPRESPGSSNPRTIPANVQRFVFERDRGRCAFVGEEGHRCGSKDQLEFDHIVPVALGGRSTVDNVRLVCRAHNQYAADQKLGREFMNRKRATLQVASGLRNLGMRPDEARRSAEATNEGSSVEERLREALRNVRVRGTVRSAPEILVPA